MSLGFQFVFLLGVSVGIQRVQALFPVPASVMGSEMGLLILALVTIMGMGAILVACVRCRRRNKRGFEEFSNEPSKKSSITTVEAIRSEFPIFQALSTPSSPQFQPLRNESSKNSDADLVDRVEILDEVVKNTTNRNDSRSLKESTVSIPKKVAEEEEQEQVCPKEDLYFNYFLEPNEICINIEPQQSTTYTEAAVTVAENNIDGLPSTFESSGIIDDYNMGNFQFRTDDKAFAIKSDPKSIPPAPANDNYDTSIEDALRELDVAIGDDWDDDVIEEMENETQFEGAQRDMDQFDCVLRQLFVSSLPSPESNVEELTVTELKPSPSLAEITAEAEKFVDSLLEECEKVLIGQHNDTTDDTPDTNVEDVEEECFFRNVPIICQSTPSVANKVRQPATADLGREPMTKQKLFANEYSGTFIVDDHANDATYDINLEAMLPCDPENLCQAVNDNTIDIYIERPVEKDNVASEEDKSTITPVNTPIEANFGEESVKQDYYNCRNNNDELNEPSTSKSGWYLHPPSSSDLYNDGFPPPPPPEDLNLGDYEDLDDADDDNDDYDRNENMNLTFDALRKHLAESLPHAQGWANESDSCGGGTGEEDQCATDMYQKGMQMNVLEAMINNMEMSASSSTSGCAGDGMNYKRSLSPILEESEDETTTAKTFILNETKNMDSTSTGCIETLGESILGVTKPLMASNDTLFNFEDTLGDREDSTPTPTLDLTRIVEPLNETFVRDPPQSTGEKVKVPGLLPPLELNTSKMDILTNVVNIADVVMSPDQQKTFSEENNSLEHHASDQDGTYTTNTIEMETCISLNRDEDESEDQLVNDEASNGTARIRNCNGNQEGNSLCDVPDITQEVKVEGSGATKENDVLSEFDKFETTKSFLDREIQYNQWHNCKIMTTENNDISSASEVSEPVIDNSTLGVVEGVHSEVTSDRKILTVCPEESTDNAYEEGCCTLVSVTQTNDQEPYLSGEEDPWLSAPFHDSNERDEEAKKDDWDSDNNGDDGDMVYDLSNDDDSSEEFMYVKGLSLPPHDVTFDADPKSQVETNKNDDTGAPQDMISIDSWTSHVDQISIANKTITHETVKSKNEGAGAGDSASDADGEFIPSCWNSTAQPQRSAMKSPDKCSGDDDDSPGCKRRARNVAFKKQHYHSVYEYPREVVPLSPSFSIPNFPTNYQRIDDADRHSSIATVTDFDGFVISSSARPFHNNQFLSQCHTWPSDGDFSWSQHQYDYPANEGQGIVTFGQIPIEWPKQVNVGDDEFGEEREEEVDEADDDDANEDDAQVEAAPKNIDDGSAESDNNAGRLSDSDGIDQISFGDLCHTKKKLTLPLQVAGLVAAGSQLQDIPVTVLLSMKCDGGENGKMLEEQPSENVTLTTPSCTGSMDSLSSSSCSDRQMTGTYERVTPQSSLEETTSSRLSGETNANHHIVHSNVVSVINGGGGGGGCVAGGGRVMVAQKLDHRSSRISDSTDEDSGIENFSRIIK